MENHVEQSIAKQPNMWLRWTITNGIAVIVAILTVLPLAINLAYAQRPAWLSGLVGGAALGLALGVGQWWLLRRSLALGPRWIFISVVGGALGLAIGMQVADYASGTMGSDPIRRSGEIVLATNTALGAAISGLLFGLALGLGQWLLLRRRVRSAAWWIVANVIGWAAGLGLAALFANLGAVGWLLIAGSVSGAVTGWLLHENRFLLGIEPEDDFMRTLDATPTANQPYRAQRSPKRLRRAMRWLLLGLPQFLIALVVIGALYQAIATAHDARTFPLPGQLVDVGGYKLHIDCLGEGAPTVVTENGLGGSVPDWGLVQPAVSRNTRICSYDRAGSGWSEAGPGPRTSQQISAELHTLLTNAGLTGPYVLVGHSAGGMHAQLYTSQYPAEVAGLVLVDPTPAQAIVHFSPEQQRAVLPNLGQFRLLEALQFLGVLRLLPLLDDPVLHSIPEALQAQVRAQRLQSGSMVALASEAAGIAESIQQTAVTTLPSDLPLFILWHGVPSEPVALEPPARAAMEALTQQSSNGRFIVAEQSGHTIPLERPELVIDAINQVIEAVRTDTRRQE